MEGKSDEKSEAGKTQDDDDDVRDTAAGEKEEGVKIDVSNHRRVQGDIEKVSVVDVICQSDTCVSGPLRATPSRRSAAAERAAQPHHTDGFRGDIDLHEISLKFHAPSPMTSS